MAVQKQVPTAEAVTILEFTFCDSSYPFVGASAGGGEAHLQEIIPRDSGEYGEFFSIMGRGPEEIMALADDHGSVDAELLVHNENGGLFEFVVSENCPAVFLGEQGALPRQVDSIDGEGRITAEVPPDGDATAIAKQFCETHSDAELVSKRKQPYTTPVFSQREFQQAIDEALTDRQKEVLTAAHEAGYYTWPRETSGEELATELNISSPTLHQHLRNAEQKIIAMVFENTLVQMEQSRTATQSAGG